MNDLDQIAINDMRHELCDMSPCIECAKSTPKDDPDYRIEHGTFGYSVRILEQHWSGKGSYVLPQTFDAQHEAVEYAEWWIKL